MPNKELADWIKEVRKRGYSNQQIKETLTRRGYKQKIINESIKCASHFSLKDYLNQLGIIYVLLFLIIYFLVAYIHDSIILYTVILLTIIGIELILDRLYSWGRYSFIKVMHVLFSLVMVFILLSVAFFGFGVEKIQPVSLQSIMYDIIPLMLIAIIINLGILIIVPIIYYIRTSRKYSANALFLNAFISLQVNSLLQTTAPLIESLPPLPASLFYFAIPFAVISLVAYILVFIHLNKRIFGVFEYNALLFRIRAGTYNKKIMIFQLLILIFIFYIILSILWLAALSIMSYKFTTDINNFVNEKIGELKNYAPSWSTPLLTGEINTLKIAGELNSEFDSVITSINGLEKVDKPGFAESFKLHYSGKAVEDLKNWTLYFVEVGLDLGYLRQAAGTAKSEWDYIKLNKENQITFYDGSININEHINLIRSGIPKLKVEQISKISEIEIMQVNITQRNILERGDIIAKLKVTSQELGKELDNLSRNFILNKVDKLLIPVDETPESKAIRLKIVESLIATDIIIKCKEEQKYDCVTGVVDITKDISYCEKLGEEVLKQECRTKI